MQDWTKLDRKIGGTPQKAPQQAPKAQYSLPEEYVKVAFLECPQPEPWLGSEKEWIVQHVMEHGAWVGRKRFDVSGLSEHVDGLWRESKGDGKLWEGVIKNWVDGPDGNPVSEPGKRYMHSVNAETIKRPWIYLWFLQIE